MPDPVVLLSRTLHVLGAIVMLGGAIFLRYVFLPSATALPEGESEKIRTAVSRRWKMFVHSGIAILLITGFYNYIAVAMPQHAGDKRYHMLMGIKILLAMGVFLIASVLPGRMPAFEGMRRNLKTWLTVTIVLATIVVVIAGALKVRGVPDARIELPPASQIETVAPSN